MMPAKMNHFVLSRFQCVKQVIRCNRTARTFCRVAIIGNVHNQGWFTGSLHHFTGNDPNNSFMPSLTGKQQRFSRLIFRRLGHGESLLRNFADQPLPLLI